MQVLVGTEDNAVALIRDLQIFGGLVVQDLAIVCILLLKHFTLLAVPGSYRTLPMTCAATHLSLGCVSVPVVLGLRPRDERYAHFCMHFRLTSLHRPIAEPSTPIFLCTLSLSLQIYHRPDYARHAPGPNIHRPPGYRQATCSTRDPFMTLWCLFFKYFVFIFSFIYLCNPVTAFFPRNNSLNTAIHADPWISWSKSFLLPSSPFKLWLIYHSFYPGY
jgi:hypothetical protein